MFVSPHYLKIDVLHGQWLRLITWWRMFRPDVIFTGHWAVNIKNQAASFCCSYLLFVKTICIIIVFELQENTVIQIKYSPWRAALKTTLHFFLEVPDENENISHSYLIFHVGFDLSASKKSKSFFIRGAARDRSQRGGSWHSGSIIQSAASISAHQSCRIPFGFSFPNTERACSFACCWVLLGGNSQTLYLFRFLDR